MSTRSDKLSSRTNQSTAPVKAGRRRRTAFKRQSGSAIASSSSSRQSPPPPPSIDEEGYSSGEEGYFTGDEGENSDSEILNIPPPLPTPPVQPSPPSPPPPPSPSLPPQRLSPPRPARPSPSSPPAQQRLSPPRPARPPPPPPANFQRNIAATAPAPSPAISMLNIRNRNLYNDYAQVIDVLAQTMDAFPRSKSKDRASRQAERQANLRLATEVANDAFRNDRMPTRQELDLMENRLTDRLFKPGQRKALNAFLKRLNQSTYYNDLKRRSTALGKRVLGAATKGGKRVLAGAQGLGKHVASLAIAPSTQNTISSAVMFGTLSASIVAAASGIYLNQKLGSRLQEMNDATVTHKKADGTSETVPLLDSKTIKQNATHIGRIRTARNFLIVLLGFAAIFLVIAGYMAYSRHSKRQRAKQEAAYEAEGDYTYSDMAQMPSDAYSQDANVSSASFNNSRSLFMP